MPAECRWPTARLGVLRRGGLRAEIVEREETIRRSVDRDLGVDRQIGVDVYQFARRQQPPSRVLVHRLAGDDDGTAGGQVARTHPDRAGRRRRVEMASAVRPAGTALEDEETVGVRVAQCPQAVGGREHDVQRVQRETVGDPPTRVDEPGGHVAIGAFDPSRDQREDPFGVGVAAHEREVLAELRLEFVEPLHDAVVGEQTVA
jgi:hypothetical protein